MKINKEFIKQVIAEIQQKHNVDLSIAKYVANQMILEGYEYTSAQQAKDDFIETLRQAGALEKRVS